MKFSTKIIATCITVLLFNNVQAQDDFTDIDYGAISSFADAFTLADSSGSLLGTDTIMAVGYFNNGFDIASNLTNLQNLFDNYNYITDDALNSSGVSRASFSLNTTNNPSAVGETIYYWVLPGVSSFVEQDIVALTEYSLINDTSWGTIPDGSNPTATDYNIRVNTPDNVVFGTSIPNGGIGGAPQINAAVIPEPSHYTVGFGLATLLLVALRRRRA